jgi:hypothetical protein
MRLCIVCPKHDGVLPRVVLSPVTVVVPKPLGTEIWDEQRDESLREEGRREVLREIAALPSRPEALLNEHGLCAFCGEAVVMTSEHAEDCLWNRAKALVGS